MFAVHSKSLQQIALLNRCEEIVKRMVTLHTVQYPCTMVLYTVLHSTVVQGYRTPAYNHQQVSTMDRIFPRLYYILGRFHKNVSTWALWRDRQPS